MTRIDFYILSATEASARWPFVCRLAEKAYGLGNNGLIYTADQTSCEHVDQLLWQYQPASFMPHAINPCPAATPLQLGYGDLSGDHHQLLINISDSVPTFFSRFERVAEIVCQEPAILAASRERFRFYRERGYELQVHNLKGAA